MEPEKLRLSGHFAVLDTSCDWPIWGNYLNTLYPPLFPPKNRLGPPQPTYLPSRLSPHIVPATQSTQSRQRAYHNVYSTRIDSPEPNHHALDRSLRLAPPARGGASDVVSL